MVGGWPGVCVKVVCLFVFMYSVWVLVAQEFDRERRKRRMVVVVLVVMAESLRD